MLKLFYYEIRKNFLRKHIIISVLCLCLFYFVFVFINFENGVYIEAKTSASFYEAYEKLHNKLDGAITQENVDFIISESKRLGKKVANKDYSTKYNENTYTGYEFGDAMFMSAYFYNPMNYNVSYRLHNDKLIEQIKDNINFYKEHGNTQEKSKNEYILSKYSNRSINAFYDTSGWSALLDDKLPNLFILLILMMGIIPSGIIDKKNHMKEVIESSVCGRNSETQSRLFAVIAFTLCVSVIFSIVRLFAFHFIVRLSGASLPIYAIETYKNSPFSCSILSFYILNILVSMIGFCAIAVVLYWISKKSKDYIFAFILSIVFLVYTIISADYIDAYSFIFKQLAIFSPYTLINFSTIANNLRIVTFQNSTFSVIFVSVIGILSLLGIATIFSILKNRWRKYI